MKAKVKQSCRYKTAFNMLQFDVSIKSLPAQGAEICRFFKRQLTWNALYYWRKLFLKLVKTHCYHCQRRVSVSHSLSDLDPIREAVVRQHLASDISDGRPPDSELENGIGGLFPDVDRFIRGELRVDGCFLLMLIDSNFSASVTAQIVDRLWKNYQERKNPSQGATPGRCGAFTFSCCCY